MLKRINVKSLLQAKETLSKPAFDLFLQHFGIEIRDAEIEDLRGLSTALTEANCGMESFDGYFVGYKIPQIGKEFDLLRFGQRCIVNIELKSASSEEKIKKQLERNKYYLSFLGRQAFTYTYVSTSKEFFHLKEDGQLERIAIDELAKLLAMQKVDSSANLDALFDPSDFLVSPFNSTKKFLTGEYFLTLQQESVKNQIVEALKPPKIVKFISIIGSAGTGKTLLTYDIAKRIISAHGKPIIIHCGQLNDGHEEFRASGWTIVSIKNYAPLNFANFDLVIVDEAQRIYERQLKDIAGRVIAANCCCIFSHDKRQTLAGWEARRDMSAKIASLPSISEFKLSDKIRTNKEIAAFIKMLFNSKRSVPISTHGNIELAYFSTTEDAKSYLLTLDRDKWEVLRFTPSQYDKEHHEEYAELSSRTSHKVIGQEFDGVVVTIDEFFSYDENGDLIYKGGAYYDPPRMLFQNISRCRKWLKLVIIGNDELMRRCIKILN
jgi:Uncharacterized conserved protein (DUF2075)